MSLAKRMVGLRSLDPNPDPVGSARVSVDPPRRRVVMPYRLEGNPVDVCYGSIVRRRVLRRGLSFSRSSSAAGPPEWFLKVMMVRAAAWWSKLGVSFRLDPSRLRYLDGREVAPEFLAKHLF